MSISIDRSAGTAAGHVMLASVVISDDDPAFTAPAGWTLSANCWVLKKDGSC